MNGTRSLRGARASIVAMVAAVACVVGTVAVRADDGCSYHDRRGAPPCLTHKTEFKRYPSDTIQLWYTTKVRVTNGCSYPVAAKVDVGNGPDFNLKLTAGGEQRRETGPYAWVNGVYCCEDPTWWDNPDIRCSD